MFSKLILSFLLFLILEKAESYEPTWESLDSRPLPQWYDDAKIGIFLHWGIYSVPPFGSEWFWKNWQDGNPNYTEYMTNNYPPNFTYEEFAPDFTTEFYDPESWANLFVQAGAKYVVLTSKHHDGFTLWPSKYSGNWNAQAMGANRDLVGELAQAVSARKELHFGLYHSLLEWYNPLYENDRYNQFKSNDFIKWKTIPELNEIVDTYKPEILWSDGEWEASDDYWRSKEFLAWLYNNSTVKDTVVVNDRWGIGTLCTHGDFYTCADRYNPGVLQTHKWENALSIDTLSWGYRRTAVLSDYLTPKDLVIQIVTTVSCGGNVLMNVGPSKEGLIDPIFQERLLAIGNWLHINGEAIYQSRPWKAQNDSITSDAWYTFRPDLNAVYASVLSWPVNRTLVLKYYQEIYKENTKIEIFDSATELNWEVSDEVVIITFPDKELVSSSLGWVIKISGF